MNDWFLLALMSLTTYRLTRLVVADDFPPILWIRDRMVGGIRYATEDEQRVFKETDRLKPDTNGDLCIEVFRRRWVPAWLSKLISCSWCASGWLSIGVVGASDAWADVPVPGLWMGAVWALGALLAAQEWA